MSKHVKLLYGKGVLPISLPDSATILQPPEIHALPDPAAAILAALVRPIGSQPLAEIVRSRHPATVAITISDITRPVPNQPIVHALLEVLNQCGVSDHQVVVVIATGMHRPSTPEERCIMLGEAILQRVEVVDHVADDAESLVQVSAEPPVSVNARFASADLKIVTGLIEPHFMAGFSGGRKGVCPGLVDLRTLQRFHGYRTMADARSTEGRLEGNLCHAEALRVARLVGVDFLVNVAITHDRQLAGIYAGDMEEAHAAGCAQVALWTGAEVKRPFDLVVTCAGGYPLDQNFYQSVKGMVTALPALHSGSTLLIASACSEIGSCEYASLMRRYDNDWRRFLADISLNQRTAKDQWQFQMQSRVLERIGVERLWIASDGLPEAELRCLCVTPVKGPGAVAQRCQQFIDEFAAGHPGSRIAAIPQGPYTMLHG